ncbi:hypothetical protein DPMN_020287 [Dreissena polymorpha]|uniref:Uncharacterized protein n=1 Tax=Dreissena polymorpha TaxID=45954 RepID=A0A9D4S829_DREPO|nr:hypothetical protein DPMN_020287 [Dreissena polymorpha]
MENGLPQTIDAYGFFISWKGSENAIPVRISSYIPEAKLTTYNGGASVRVRGPAGGYWHNKPTPYKYPVQSTLQISNQAYVHLSGYKVNDSSESQALFAPNTPPEYKPTTLKPQYNIHGIYSTPTGLVLCLHQNPTLNIHLYLRNVGLQIVCKPTL